MSMYCNQCEQTAGGFACTVAGVCGKTPEVSALQDLLLHAVKGLSLYASEGHRFSLKEPSRRYLLKCNTAFYLSHRRETRFRIKEINLRKAVRLTHINPS